MATLEKLLAELCPDGVEYKELCELFITRNGYTPSKSNNEYWTDGSIPWFRMEDIRENGNILSDSIQKVSKKAVKGKLFPANSIIVATSATIGEHALITVDSLANQRFTYLMLKESYREQFNIMFLFYYCYKLDEWCLSHLNQGSFPSVDMSQFPHFKFPVPPLAVQSEIVRILDYFTELTSNLAAELAARKKQYEYYRDLLLDDDTRNCQWRTVKLLDMLCQPITDGPHTTPTFVDKGIPFVSVDSVWDGKIHFENMRGFITEEFDLECCKKYKPQKHDVYMVKSGSTTGKVAYVDTGARFNIWSPLAAMRVNKDNSSRFLYHLLQTKRIQEMVQAKASHGSQPNLGMRELEKFEVTIPPLAEQLKIVAILDRFDKLCNDISEGLPAEIEARRKQYEYYRDKLLTFKEC